MRSPATPLLAIAVFVVLGLAAAVPLWAGASSNAEPETGPRDVPAGLYGDLFNHCVGTVGLDENRAILPQTLEGQPETVTVDLYRFDPDLQGFVPVEPSADEQELVDRADACLADYRLLPWRDSPRFDAVHSRMYYEYLSRYLVPCLNAHGFAARVPSVATFETFDLSTWQSERGASLAFDEKVRAWTDCPLVPSYLQAAAYPPDVRVLLP